MAAPRPEPAVEVVYATAYEQRIVRVPFVQGLTAEQAVRESGLVDALPEIAARPLVLGVFGVRVELRHRLAPADRVEICRPLQRDPRDRRRELAR
jgi:putative ubiquitin-RnfH superfamily antitoxin RatB of RatAB toxin-antitoxin module